MCFKYEYLLRRVVGECYTFYDFYQQRFSVPQIEYLLGGSSKKGSHVYFLLIVAMVLLW